MICHETKCIFVHQRKCAGTSVLALFPGAEARPLNNGILGDTIPTWDWHDPALKDYYRFAIWRNPYDRFVSGWKYCTTTRNRPIEDVLAHLPAAKAYMNVIAPGASTQARLIYSGKALDRTASILLRRAKALLGLEPYIKYRFSHDYLHITRQQHETLFYSDGTMAVNRIVFFERLAEGLGQVFDDLGIPPRDLGHLNQTGGRKPYQAAFTPRAREMFKAQFADDLMRFHYNFETGLPAIEAASVTRETM